MLQFRPLVDSLTGGRGLLLPESATACRIRSNRPSGALTITQV